MENSILNTIKKQLGIEKDVTHFDEELIVHINACLLSITQLGVGSKNGFMVTDENTAWDGLLGERTDLEAVKTLLYMKVRVSFDPPSNSFLLESLQRTIEELTWRILLQLSNVMEV